MRFSLVTTLGLASIACAQDLISFLESRDDLSSLLEALQKVPDLVEQLSSTSGFTLLAPTNDALEGVPGPSNDFETSADILAGDDTTAITNVLSYHVLNGTLSAEDFGAEDGRRLFHTLYDNGLVTGGQVVGISSSEGVVYIASGTFRPTQVGEADIEGAGDGILIHTISAPLELPPTLSELGQRFQNGGDPPVVAALADAGLLDDVEMLTDLTLFSPSFNADSNVIDFDSVDSYNITEVLEYHAVAGTGELITFADLVALENGSSIETIQGGSITVTVTEDELSGPIPSVDGIRLGSYDVLIANGIVHDIANILSPTDSADSSSGGLGQQDEDDYQGQVYDGSSSHLKLSMLGSAVAAGIAAMALI